MSGAVNVGRLVVSVSGDVDQLKVDMREAQAIAGAATKEIVNGLHGVTDATYDRNNAGKRMIAAMREEIATFGMGADELKVYRASLLGVGAEAQQLIDRTNAMKSAQASFTQEAAATSSALRSHGAAANEARGHVEGFSFATAGAKRELLVLAHELSQGNYKKFGGSLMVLGEQTGAAGLLFSAAGIAAIGMGAAFIGVAVAVTKGATEQREMNNALILTGNYAGQTSDSLNNLAHAAVASGGSIGEAKKAVTQLAASGKFTGEQLGSITSAVVGLEHATGASIEETIKQFESLSVQAQGHSARASTAISQATIKLNEQYHFLTLSVYNQITAMEKEGDLRAASKIATDEFARATKERSEEMVANLGWLARGWNGVKEAIGGAADALGNMGKKSTAAAQVALLESQLAAHNVKTGAYAVQDDPHTGRGGAQLGMDRTKMLADLAKAQAELNRVNEEASAKADKSLRDSNAVQAAQRIDSMLLRAQAKDQGALTTALKEYHESLDRLRAGNTEEEVDPRLTESAIKAGEAALTKLHSQAAKGKDDRAARLQDALTLEQTSLDREKSIYDARGKMLDMYHSKFGLSDDDYFAGRKTAQADYIASEAITFAKESSLISSFKSKNPEEIAANKGKLDALIRQHLEFNDKIEAERQVDAVNSMATAAAVQSASDDANNKYLSSLDAQVRAIEVANGKHAKSASLIAEEAAAQFRLAAAAMAVQAAGPADGGHTQDDADAAKSMLETLLLQADAQERIAAALRDGQAAAASQKLADMAIQDWQRAGQSIGESLANAFGTGGKALGGIFKAYSDGMSAQLRAQKELAVAKKLGDDNPEKIAAINRAQLAGTQAQLKSYGDMADAAQGFFEQGSKGYQAMHGASQVLHAAELALTVVKGINAVLTQGEGDPYSAFGRMAAMAAIVTGLGVAISGGGGGGGRSAADAQKVQGTGSFYGNDGKLNTSDLTGGVFGDASAKSDSIRHSMDLIGKNSSDMLPINQGMLIALQNIESSMSGLTNLIVRVPGLIDGTNMGIRTGQLNAAGSPTDFISRAATLDTKMLFGPGLGSSMASFANNLWGKVKQNVVDSGIQFGGSVSALQAGQGYQQYASVDTAKSSYFGLSKKTRNSVQTQGLDSELSAQFGLIFTGLEDSLKAASVALGGDAKSVSDVLDTLTLKSTKVSLKGLTGTALTDALNGVISKSMDEVAQAVFPQFESFRKVGEGYAETVMRVASDYAKLDAILGASGMTFGAVGLSSVKAREDLIKLAGGIDALGTKSASFSKNFLSKAEQLAPVQKYVSDQLSEMGLSGITTRKQFKDLVLGLDKTTDAGQKEYVALLDLADAFAQTHAATVDLSKSTQEIADERKGLQDQLDQATMTSTQLLAKQRNALDDSNQALFDQVQAANAATAMKSAWASLTDTIVGEVRRIRGLLGEGAGQSLAGAQSQFSIATAQARAGDQDAAKLLPGLSQAMLTLAESSASTALDLRRIQAMTAASLSVTADIAAAASGNPIPIFGASTGSTQSGVTSPANPSGLNAPIQSNQGDSTIAKLLTEMQSMRQEMSQMRTENRAQQTAIAQNTEKTAKVLVRNDTGAGILTTTTVPA